MKILHVCETVPGGIGGYLDEIIPFQISEGFETHLLAPFEHNEYLNKSIIDLNSHYYRRNGRNVKSFTNLLIKLRRVCIENKFDVIVVHSTFAGLITRLLKLFSFALNKSKLIYYPHGISLIMSDNTKLKQIIFATTEIILAKLATDAIVCVSHYECNILENHHIGKNKIHVIHNGITIVNNDARVIQESKPLKILFVGRFDKEKGLYKLLNSISELKREFEFRAVGMQTRGKEVDLTFPSNSIQLGWLKRAEIFNQYHWADVLVVPSEWEAFGLVAIEGMSAGCPVIASNVGGLPEIVQNNISGYLFEQEDIAQLTRLIENTSKKQFEIMGEHAKQRYSDLFTAVAMAEKTNNLIKQLCQ